MAQSPPGVGRVVSVLNFFAAHPRQSFSFTDIVRALKLRRATCHALLGGLVEADYLYRNVDKTYVIGPALVALGRIGTESFSPLQVAEQEMRILADELDAFCSAIFFEQGDAVVRLRAAGTSHLGWSVPQGKRLPLRAPFGAIFFMTSPQPDVEKWLDQLVPSATPEQRSQMFNGIVFARLHGFCFGVRNLAINPDHKNAPELAFSGEMAGNPISLMSELISGDNYSLAFLAAPVLDNHGQVAFVLTLTGFTHLVTGEKVAVMGHRLSDAANRVTTYFTGKKRLTELDAH